MAAEAGKAATQGGLKNFLAWGSIAYGAGFVVVMLHTARLGFPVLELLSAVHVWVGAPLAAVGFFWLRMWRAFRSRATHLSQQLQGSWAGLKQGVAAKDFEVISQFLGAAITMLPILALLRGPLGALLSRAMGSDPDVRRRAARTVGRIGHFLRVVQSVYGFFRLVMAALTLVFAIYLYVWVIYPLVPQSLGGGAPVTVRLVLAAEKIPAGVPGLIATDPAVDPETAAKAFLTEPVQLLYATEDHVYIEGAEGHRLSLSKDVADAVIWTVPE